MSRFAALAAAAALLLILNGCGSPKEYRLTSEQLAWQGYQAGQVLRFGRAQDGTVRTYKVTEIKDELRTQNVGISFGKPPKYQEISVRVQRIDTIAPTHRVLDLYLYNEPDYERIELRATADWDQLTYIRLPIDSVSRNAPIDTARYRNTTLLTNVTLGPATYPQVLYIVGKAVGNPAAQSRIYFARGKGLVAFDEDGKGLWYRVP